MVHGSDPLSSSGSATSGIAAKVTSPTHQKSLSKSNVHLTAQVSGIRTLGQLVRHVGLTDAKSRLAAKKL
eukprot:3571802-Amphidinium_carterae.1